MASDSLCQARAFVGVRAGMEPKRPLFTKEKPPRACAHRGYSLTRSNPATLGAPCI